ncbi:MAG: TIM barrel protein [Clostridia bacterium]
MGQIKIGAQLYSLRKYLKKPEDVPYVFDKVQKMGAEVVQVSGMCKMDSKKLNEISKEYNLPICITHSPIERIKNDLDNLANEHLDFGCKNIGIGMMPKCYRTGKLDDLKKFVELLNATAEKLSKYDMTIAYHNHWFEFKEVGGELMYDYLIDNTETKVQFIPDTFWIKVGGFEPNFYIEKLANRVNTLHLKDYKKTIIPIFKPIGDGILDFKSILACAEKANIKNAVVELDISLKPFSNMEKSLKYLKTIY